MEIGSRLWSTQATLRENETFRVGCLKLLQMSIKSEKLKIVRSLALHMIVQASLVVSSCRFVYLADPKVSIFLSFFYTTWLYYFLQRLRSVYIAGNSYAGLYCR
jgi:hypothetical protein